MCAKPACIVAFTSSAKAGSYLQARAVAVACAFHASWRLAEAWSCVCGAVRCVREQVWHGGADERRADGLVRAALGRQPVCAK